ncbi:MAG: acetyltransferase [Gammaproteobacteria bacterium]|nr:acetyltransferase [Gammaproteobacteria bacterium]NIR81815.1 acetyltransferase [Gammaproteobacteria bacterium]NIR88647.1 acetyltransferase [Gammaproteobacteria bacterium]NIU02923.1 acetyltransferase [Gammaproteobacteria bacterium]NIV50444.1 acetyltransferase [Gammaproteobacteria bacterium]
MRVREACMQAAVEGYQNAAVSGLCAEGAREAAVSAGRRTDSTALVAKTSSSDGG